ncbi:glutamate formimidoyltransferase [Neolewinella lacunae]|uniref:glutamate formimidoyltransferase n=1 Tax=Neolewinella lacunae TaxID=1517758 RepID=A0A923PH14_9BACT|nr:glutamate formimidoyltransferase [Neolewinella lacunae]MBC6993134.1 glutamate formimidoyltransferase [Neolewinella lacunae]MDN3633132.1 glutamate formimidoyltransferase [Neolewinella lacunae]
MPKSPLLECIVNVSEGRNATTLAAFAAAIESVPGCMLLHQDVGAGAHRTVFTFAGRPQAVVDAARLVYSVAAERIDMRTHHGEHPRIGAVDVCPFVPISGISLPEVVALTQVLGQELGESLGIPVFLYAASATAAHRANLADIRRGGYEGLAEKVKDPAWLPDFGPRYNPTFGATVLGARPFLIAWNINLAPNVPLATAKALAAKLRGSGSQGKPGLFPGLRAIGWHLPEYGRCQISCNVVDAEKTDLAKVYLTAVSLAKEMGADVTGSELIGLIPERYLRRAGKAFSFSGDREEELDAAVEVLGLGDLTPFNWRERVLEALLASH